MLIYTLLLSIEKAITMKIQEIGSYAFIAGVAIAIIASIITLDAALVTGALVAIGVIVGLINVTEKETRDFLLAAVSVVIVSYFAGTGFGAIPMIGEMLRNITVGIMTFVTPAVIIVALKQIWAIARAA